MKGTIALFSGCLILLFSCGTTTPDDPAAVKTFLASKTEVSEPTDAPKRWVIEEDEKQPDLFLTVHVSLPDLLDDKVYRLPLRRWQPPADHFPLIVGHMEAADGQTATGQGIGYVGGVNVVNTTDNVVVLEVSLAGTDRTLRHVDVTEQFSVPWAGSFDGKLGTRGHIHAEFQRPGM